MKFEEKDIGCNYTGVKNNYIQIVHFREQKGEFWFGNT